MEKNKKKTLTIFTPSYNRAHTLSLGYKALLNQSSRDFVWLIVDDGSTDNTRELVEGWIQEGKIDIRYHYQHNQGMHGAHNTAYRLIDTELNTCIDSDDYIAEDAVEKLIHFWQEKGSDRFAGMIGLDVDMNGKLIGTNFPIELEETTLSGFYARGGRGDKKIVYRTDIIKKYPEYPIFEGEKYVGLAYKYMLVDRDYPLLVLNEPLVVVDYQEDGSSVNMYKQYWNNPRGFAFFRKTEMQMPYGLKRKFMVCVHYVSSSIISRNRSFIQESPQKGMTLLATPFGWLLYHWVKWHIRHNKHMQKPV